ncbi:hypothetical protein DL770_000576 [Monosporascus sp. CRB-9-2]|nr:hypothetical protein DL770_000576 [Monosporascus sp. CRB-9-2]
MPKLKIRNNSRTAGQCIDVAETDTAGAVKEKIRAELDLQREFRVYFPGVKEELPDHEPVIEYVLKGATVNIDLTSDSEDDEQEQQQEGAKGSGAKHRIKMNRNVAKDHADQKSVVTNLNQVKRATEADICENEASDNAGQVNGIFNGVDSAAMAGSLSRQQGCEVS